MSPHLNPWRTLRSAARYVHQFRDQIFVIKLGGELLGEADSRRRIAEQLAVLWQFSIPLVIVHGGGGDLDRLCHSQGVAVEKKGGRRITSPEVLEAAKMRFVGSTQTNLLADLRAAGLSPVGLSGVDAALVTAEKRPPVAIDGEQVDFGEVGDITAIRPAIIHQLLASGHLPVIAPLTADDSGRVFNTNADTLAASLAASLKAEKLFYMLETAGLLADVNDPASLLSEADPDTLKQMIAEGAIQGGMQPKAESVIQALAGGVARVHLVSGLDPDALLEEVFTNEGSGTMIHGPTGVHGSTALNDGHSNGSARDQKAVAHVG